MYRLNEDIIKFTNLIEKTDFQNLDISQYNKDYIRKNHSSVNYSANLAFQILSIGIKNCKKPLEQITVAEIGGGIGIISLMAKFLGTGNVIYSDIYSQSCNDFKIISGKLGLIPSKIICGSINELYTETNGQVDIIVSRDVIEHIYDLKDFFDKCNLSFNRTIHVHNTSANIYNIFKKNYFKKIHNIDELTGSEMQLKPSDSVLSFLELRYKFIKENFPQLDEKTLKTLAKLTRGKIYNDIKTDIEKYISSKILPTANPHPTNTCDPVSGNRTENLMTFEEYEKLINKSLFQIKWHFAFYDLHDKNCIRKLIKILFNFYIKFSGQSAKYIAPAIILECIPMKKSS